MRIPHFYAGNCQLGLAFPPHGTTELNLGVETGPQAILSPQFTSTLTNYVVDSYDFPLVAEINKSDFYTHLSHQLVNFAEQIRSTLLATETQIVLGGDHAVTFSSLLALFSRIDPTEVGYIQFDSHGDLHQYKTSPSGNFHGMYVRPFVDEFDIPEIAKLVPKKLPTANMIYVGNLDLEIAEQEFFQTHHIRNINQSEIAEDKDKIHKEISEFMHRYKHIHINLDVDVFDHSVVSATGIPAAHGLYWNEIAPLLTILKSHDSWSLDLVEVNPQRAGAGETVRIAQQIITTLLSDK